MIYTEGLESLRRRQSVASVSEVRSSQYIKGGDRWNLQHRNSHNPRTVET